MVDEVIVVDVIDDDDIDDDGEQLLPHHHQQYRLGFNGGQLIPSRRMRESSSTMRTDGES
jgi:hypothetical protein